MMREDDSGFGLGPGADEAPASDEVVALASAAAAADGISATLLTVLVLLHARRAVACRAAPSQGDGALWDWMCATDPFASYSFLPLHLLSAAAVAARCFRARCGGALRASGGHDAAASTAKLELYLAAYAMCWFSVFHPFAASADCADNDPSCAQWAAASECQKNRDFMLKTCRLACKACVADGHASASQLGPRAVSMGAGGALLVLASSRLLLASVSEPSQRRVLAMALLMLRPVVFCAGVVMRTPCAPIVRLVLRLLRLCAGQALALLRFGASMCMGCGSLCRRSLIVALGGKVDPLEKAFTD